MRKACALLLVLLFLGSAVAEETTEGLITAYFRSESDRDRKKILVQLRALDPVPAKAMKGYRKLVLSLMREGSKSFGPITAVGLTITASRPRSMAARTRRSPWAFERS